jgi:hypothetical protein
MNRNDEYNSLLTEQSETPAALAGVVERAKERSRKATRLRRAIATPICGFAAFLVVFVAAVNMSVTFAMACGKVPLLRELAAAVAFSPSLSAAVANEYVQPIDLEQTINGVTMRVEYVIVDQKQLNIFYTLRSQEYSNMGATPQISDADGVAINNFSMYGGGSFGLVQLSSERGNGGIRRFTLDFMEKDMPSSLNLTCKISDNGSWENAVPMPVADVPVQTEYSEPNWIAAFDFALHFDPNCTNRGEVFTVNQAVATDGQNYTVTTVEIYPTHLRLNVTDNADNTMWLQGLDFYVVNEKGERFDGIKNGISATGSEDSPMMTSYRLESPYFSKSKWLTVVISGATFSDKESIFVDLKNGTIKGALPVGAKFTGAERNGSGWTLMFTAPKREREGTPAFYQVVGGQCYGEDGHDYYFNVTSSTEGYYDEVGEYVDDKNVFTERCFLPDYPYDTVWLTPINSRVIELAAPIEIAIK